MSEIEVNNFNNNDDDDQTRQTESEQRYTPYSSIKRSQSDDHLTPVIVDDEYEPQPVSPRRKKPSPKPAKLSYIPKLKTSKNISTSMIITRNKSPVQKWNGTPASSSKTPRPMAVIPSINRRPVQGVLIRLFRNGDAHHIGVKVGINELEFKSWEAFLNYLNRQQKLTLPSGGIQHVYALNGHEIRSINKFQNRQSYVVATGIFLKTKYLHVNDAFNDDSESNVNQPPAPNGNTRALSMKRWRLPAANNEQIFILPYSRLNLYESILLNRNTTTTYDQWLNEEVTDLLSHYIGNDIITHLYAITKTVFAEVTSFSYLFNTLKTTDKFIACTDEEFQHAKRYLATMQPDEFFANNLWPRRQVTTIQRYVPKPVNIDANLSISWVHGYDGTKEQTKNIYALAENEILYVIGSICVIYDPEVKQQRFYTKHNNPITCVSTHKYHTIIASADSASTKERSYATIHIWDYEKLETLAEIRKDQFGSDISLLSFSPKPDDNLILIVSRDKPKVLLFFDWKRNEIIYSITSKSDKILSALFVFDTIEWIVCITQQHLIFYQINWKSKPLRIATQRESEVQNIYTGAVACDHSGELLVIGDKVGSIHIWTLVDNEPKLEEVQESILENDVHLVVCINQETFLLANGQNQIKLWNVNLNTFDEIQLNDTYGSIQSICHIEKGLAIGTKLNYILLKEIDNEQIDVIMRGHRTPSMCICCNKNTDDFFSISSDRHLFKWNNKTRSVEWAVKSPQLISCAALHPERNIIVLGTETSKLLIYDTLSSFYITTISLKTNTGVKSVRFSPDGADLAIGLQNGAVFIFSVLGNGEFHLRTDGTLQNNNVPVTDIIWSIDSSYLLAVYSDNNYNIWLMPSFDIVKEKNIQNIPWQQATHPMACNTIDKSIMEMQTSAIVLSPNLVLCCSKDGQIRLFGNFYERSSQILQTGLGSVQSMTPSTNNNAYLLSLNNSPAIVEVIINVESQ
ncbi:unnamed protein product [Adineta steineri]|uniref:Doublecortin domain-containing protein n=1 Tax=Adineta steineri TaxID=433720 RepID=A0A814EIX5_9BILA|nr:unnamed protein product [Adineta steineri]